MAVKAELTNSRRTVSELGNLTKLSLTDEFEYEELQMVEPLSGWCGGDFPGDAQEPDLQESPDDISSRDDVKFKDALIEELLKSNHELRMKFAEAENKIAKMRARIDSHCECCARNKGADVTERKRNHNDWSTRALHSFGLDSPYTSPYKVSQDNTNPYIKVRRWQNAISGEFSRAESTSSSTIQKSPNCLTPRSGTTQPEFPATRDQGIAANYMLVPLGESGPPSGFRRIDLEDSRPGSPQKLTIFRGDQQEDGYEIDEESPSRHLPTVKSSPDERILSSRQLNPKSGLSAPSALRPPRTPRNYENLETQRVDQYGHYAAVQKTKKYILSQHANISQSKANADDRGIVGRLMAAPTGCEQK